MKYIRFGESTSKNWWKMIRRELLIVVQYSVVLEGRGVWNRYGGKEDITKDMKRAVMQLFSRGHG